MADNIYSTYHYHIKTKKDREAVEVIKNTVEKAGTAIANYQQPIVAISEKGGTVNLKSTNIYTMEVNDAVTFILPTTVNKQYFNQIKMMIKVVGNPTVDWGTTYFFDKKTPDVGNGSYDIYFDYDNLLGAWVCGYVPKGAAI